MAEKSANSENFVSTQRNILKVLLFVFSSLAGVYTVYLKGEWIWFSWHPVSMIFGFIFLAGFSILTKKAGGYTNTKVHGILMGVVVILACFGWYVIYSNKEIYGKPHLVTLHAKLGVGVLLAYIAIASFSFPALNPDWGFLRTNKIVRFAHKWSARVLTALAWLVCYYGFQTMEPRFEYQLLFGASLVLFSLFTLL